jgi:uncharacterized protein (DUF2461 family)
VGGVEHQPLFLSDDVVKLYDAAMITILPAGMQGDQVETLFTIDHDDRLTRDKRAAFRWHG